MDIMFCEVKKNAMRGQQDLFQGEVRRQWQS